MRPSGFTSIESYRNRITGYGVVLFRWDQQNGATYVVRCTEHGVMSDEFRNVTVARKYLHKPWTFCEKCDKIWRRKIGP